MKTKLLSLIFLSIASCLLFPENNAINAQVGINTSSPEPGAILDIDSSDKGLMIPKVSIGSLSSISPITGVGTTVSELADAEGLLVYNTNGTIGEGFYYWNGTIWVTIDGEKNWKLGGNTGTNPGYAADEHFIGTIDEEEVYLGTEGIGVLTLTTNQRVRADHDGSKNIPNYSFTSDPNTGLWRSSSDRLNFSSGGREMAEFLEAGANSMVSFNDNADDTDFRIESLNQENMLYVNAEENMVLVRNTNHHIPSYIDPFNSYANGIDDGSATVGIQYAIAGWNQGTLGGGINGVIEDSANPYAAIEGSTEGDGDAVRGVSSNSDANAVHGSIPITGSWLGFGGLFEGGLGYIGGLYNISDERIKKDITIIEGALEKIKKIDGVSYKYDYAKYSNNPKIDENTYYGFTAQNIKKYLPHAVKEKNVTLNKQTNRSLQEKEILNVVDYTALIPVLVEAMKEQQAQIEVLKEEIEALKK
jgi:hypothetical protein